MKCAKCNHDLIGLPEGCCPACGTAYTSPPDFRNYTLCPDCFYDLVGNTSGRCPECGGAFTPEDIERTWQARMIAPDTVILQLLTPAAILLVAMAVGPFGPLFAVPLGFVGLLGVVFYSMWNCARLAKRIEYTRAMHSPQRRAKFNPNGIRKHLIAVGLYIVQLGIAIAGCGFCVSAMQ